MLIGIETDRGPWVQALLAAGYVVYPINPLQAARYRQRHGTSGAKSDPGDAHVLAEIVRLDREHHRPLVGDSEIADEVKVLARSHQSLIWSRQRQANMLRSMLREYYPAALTAFGDDLAGRDCLAVLAIAPTPEQVVHSGELIGAAAREAMDDLREVLGVLRAGEPGASDLVPPPRRDDIVRLVEASRSAGVQTELCMEVDDLPDAIARTVHRVVGEGLTNVHKHARDAATVVTVRGDRQVGVAIEVVNRRPAGGPSLLPGSGLGLLGLAERIALQGGTLDHGPAADGGWRLSAWLPWSP